MPPGRREVLLGGALYLIHTQGATEPPPPSPLPSVHDPVIAKEGGSYYVFCTGRGISVLTSKDRVNWETGKRVFDTSVSWAASTIPGSTDRYWAPDISFYNGKWHLYYSVSTFGSNRSAIGLATNATLDPNRPNYQWHDEGIVVISQPTDNYNAIDPNMIQDEHGRPWLAFGSFWGGIRLVPLNPTTGKPEKEARLISLAARPHTPEIQGSVEAPFLVRRGSFYYLFVSFDFCCRGVDSTYNIRVGRAPRIEGPYVDREGHPMQDGGGTLIRAGSERWRGPGHNAVFRDGKTDWLVYHAYDSEDKGIPKLRLEKLTWSRDGWPEVATIPEQKRP